MSWIPHGLIQTQYLEEPYQAARRSVDASGNSMDPKEYATVHLFESLFQIVLFPQPNFVIHSQVPPTNKPGTDKACDIAVKYIDPQFRWHILCFAEAKRASSRTPAKIRDLEDQAQLYCEAFLLANPEETRIYACTLVGVSVRCWLLDKGCEDLIGFWDGDTKDDFRFYKDIGRDDHREIIQSAFDLMKAMPGSSLRINQPHSQIGAMHYSGSTSSQASMVYNTHPAIEQTIQPSSSVPVVSLDDKNYVTIKLLQRESSVEQSLYEFEVGGGQRLEKRGFEFFSSMDPQGYPCMVYHGRNSNIFYWTRTLDPDSDLVKVAKGKGKRKGRH